MNRIIDFDDEDPDLERLSPSMRAQLLRWDSAHVERHPGPETRESRNHHANRREGWDRRARNVGV